MTPSSGAVLLLLLIATNTWTVQASIVFIPRPPLSPTPGNCTLAQKIDLAIIYDGSESMGSGANLQLVKEYMKKIVELLDVQSDASKGSRVAVWSFTVQTHLQFLFDSFKSKQGILNAMDRIRDLGSAGIFVPEMFDFIATDVFNNKNGARYSDSSVKKVAVVILDSPILFSASSPSVIQQKLQNAKVDTYAIILGDEGLTTSQITPYLPIPSPAFSVASKQSLPNFTGLHEAFKQRYGCNPCDSDNPCKNGGKCSVQNDSPYYKCECIGGWRSYNCDAKDPCLNNPCNGYTCVPTSTQQFTCVCPANCSFPTDCSTCKTVSPCSKKPCFNNCQCKESATHEGGFICHSPGGHLGKFCDISKADITCGPAFIEVRVPYKVVQEYEAGVPGAVVYLSDIPSKEPYNCLATYDASQGKYVIKVPSPFSTCGIKKTASGGGHQYANSLWMNRVSTSIDMPVPVVRFKCVYNSSETVISTSLQPVLGSNAPVVTNLGSFNVTLNAFKHPPGKLEKDREMLTNGAVYTVGQEIFLTATLRSTLPGITTPASQLAVKILECFATSAPNTQNDKLNLVTNGCPESAIGVKMVENAVGSSATIGFVTFRLGAKYYVYYTCRIDVCIKNHVNCRPNNNCPAIGRRKRNAEKEKNLLAIGPLIILSEDEKSRLLTTLGDVIPSNYVAGEIVDLNEEDPKPEELSFLSHNLPIVVVSLTNFFFLMIFALLALCFYIRQHFSKSAN